jgi:hypothetical protein
MAKPKETHTLESLVKSEIHCEADKWTADAAKHILNSKKWRQFKKKHVPSLAKKIGRQIKSLFGKKTPEDKTYTSINETLASTLVETEKAGVKWGPVYEEKVNHRLVRFATEMDPELFSTVADSVSDLAKSDNRAYYIDDWLQFLDTQKDPKTIKYLSLGASACTDALPHSDVAIEDFGNLVKRNTNQTYYEQLQRNGRQSP